MSEASVLVSTIYAGWETYQSRLITALRLLTDEQAELRPAAHMRSIEEIVTHMIGARARWLHDEDPAGFGEFTRWDSPSMPVRSAAELVMGLETTWRLLQEAIARWTPAQWQETFPGEPPDEPAQITRQWVLWHLLEHDLHHGGEVSLTLGMHGYLAPDL